MTKLTALIARPASYPWGQGAQRFRALMVLAAGLGAAVVTALVCALTAWVSAGNAALDSLLASTVVIVFFTLAQGVQVMVAEKSPLTILLASLGSFVVRMVALGITLAWALQRTDSHLADSMWLKATLLLCTAAWLIAEVVAVSRLRVPIYDHEYVPASTGGA